MKLLSVKIRSFIFFLEKKQIIYKQLKFPTFVLSLLMVSVVVSDKDEKSIFERAIIEAFKKKLPHVFVINIGNL